MRHLSSKSDTTDGQEELEYLKNFQKLGPGDSSRFIQQVEIAAKELSSELDIGILKAEFERDIRPILASHCLMLPFKVDNKITAFFHGQVHGLSKLNVLYLSSLDVMLRVKLLKESERKPLIDQIVHRRVLIADDWLNTYGNIELLKYDFRERGTSFVRGECDASFEPLKKQKQFGGQALGSIIKKGLAKLAFVIWKEKELIWAEIFEGVPCNGSAFAEALSALALLMKCENEEFSMVEVWSDSARACGVMSGSQAIKPNDPDHDALLLLRSMHTKFKKLVIVQKPRELMFFADQLLRMDGYSGCPIKKAIQSWSSNLKGSTIFKISNNKATTEIIDTFVDTRKSKEAAGFRYQPNTIFYLRVGEGKFEELQRLRRFLSPSCLYLVMDDLKLKSSLKELLEDRFTPTKTVGNTAIFHELGVADQKKRNLIIVWDASIPRAHYHQTDTDSCIIIFALDDEVKEIESRGIVEINVETFLYFH